MMSSGLWKKARTLKSPDGDFPVPVVIVRERKCRGVAPGDQAIMYFRDRVKLFERTLIQEAVVHVNPVMATRLRHHQYWEIQIGVQGLDVTQVWILLDQTRESHLCFPVRQSPRLSELEALPYQLLLAL